ncbi:MAG: glycosyltransferase [Caldiserica bacterium]|nr:glycosyltransferase [Caldisericota bacterium]
MKRIRILHLVSTLDIGGVQKQIVEVVKRLEGESFANYVGSFSSGRVEEFLRKANIPVMLFRRDFRFDPFLPLRIAAYLKKEKIDILHTYLFTANTWGRLGGIIARTPVLVASERNAIPWKNFFHILLDSVLSFPTSRIIACSYAVKDLNQKKGFIKGEKIKVIYNGIDTEKFIPGDKKKMRQKLNLPQQAFIVGSVGRLHWCKGFSYLLRAVSLLQNAYPNLYLMIVGEGEEHNNLEKLATRLNLRKRIIFTGEVEETLPFIQSWDVGVFPSLYEGFGISIAEAMACGIPVIASRTGGIPEVIGAAGIIVERKHPRQLAKAIEQVINSPSLRATLGKEGRERIKNHFSLSRTVNEWANLYLALYQKRIRQGNPR